jgi:SAM-dependent methyltransferase
MPITPDVVERAAIRLNLVPGVLLDFLGAQAFRTVCAAVELGIFEALGDGPANAAEVARRAEASERGVRLLLEALETLGYVKKQRNGFAASPMTVKWLLRRSRAGLADAIPFFDRMVFDRWENLAESIRRGEPVINGYDWLALHPEQWSAYEEAMLAIARIAAPEIVAKSALPRTARRLLDIGGGHGLYAIAFCRRYPELSAAILDLAPALESARRTIARENMAARITTIEGDLRSSDFAGGYDVVLLFNVLHGFPPDANVALLRRIAASNGKATILIVDQTPTRGGGAAQALARLQALNFFNDLGARTYTVDEICGWLTGAGFADFRRQSLRSIPGFTLLSALKKRQGEH